MVPAGYAPLTERARAARNAVWAVMVVQAIVILSDVYVISLMGASQVTPEDFDRADAAIGLAGLAQLGSSIAAAVFFIRWFRQAYRNVDVLQPGARTHSHGWAGWGWFVPIANWFRPKQIANEIARCRDTADGPVPSLTAWWALWLIGSILGNVVGRFGIDAQTADELVTLSWLDIVASGVLIAAGFLAVTVILELTYGQEELAERRAVAGDPPPAGDPVDLVKPLA